MKATRFLSRGCIGPALLVLLSGCGDAPKDNWYEESSAVDQREREYVEQQMRHGMTEVEAKRAFGLQYSIELTGRRENADVEGPQLKDKVQP